MSPETAIWWALVAFAWCFPVLLVLAIIWLANLIFKGLKK